MSSNEDAPRWTVNDLVRTYLMHYDVPPSGRGKVLGRLARCRTPVLGGHVLACDQCGAEEYVYNSCLDRHCPTCLGKEARAWVEKQQESLLPTPYFHVVFTLPRPVADLALYNKEALYALLMRVSAEVLKTIAGDRKYLGGEIGFLSVLHTWSQTLEHHPHVHIVVPGGALSSDGIRWTPPHRRPRTRSPHAPTAGRDNATECSNCPLSSRPHVAGANPRMQPPDHPKHLGAHRRPAGDSLPSLHS